MPVTVTVSRGRPLPWLAAMLFTVGGAAMVAVGLALGPLDAPGGATGTFPIGVAVVVVALIWALYVVLWVRGARRRRPVDPGPETLTEPPSEADPAVVATVLGRGRVPAVAAAATVLGLAERGLLDLHVVGDGVIVSFSESAKGRRPVTATDEIVLRALDARRDPATGDVHGPPLWGDDVGWWRGYARDAHTRAAAAGLLEPRLPLIGLMLACILSATVIALAIFWYTMAFVGMILLANGIPHLLARAGGYRLSAAGERARAQWLAFGRGLRDRGGLVDAGPGAVAIWGPYLVYGVLLGAGPQSARDLAPDVGAHAELPPDSMVVTL